MISLSYKHYTKEPVFWANIAPDTFKVNVKGSKDSKKLLSAFIFSPEQEDDDIDAELFQKKHLDADEMEANGIKATVIR